nr:hypothetical protein [Parabacteroides goldsteinii]
MLELFKYYKGEKDNPFKVDSLEALFWFYESKFKEFYEAGQFKDTPVDRAFADYLYEIFNERIPEKFGIKPETLNKSYFR